MLANVLSLLRVFLLLPLLYSLSGDTAIASPASLALLALAAATDLADGYLARRLGQTSRVGKILDPLADKIFLGGLGIALTLWFNFPVWLAVMLLARDLVILLTGLFLLCTRNLVIPANWFGKYTTVCLILAALMHLIPVSATLRHWSTSLAALMLLLSSLSYTVLLCRTLARNSSAADVAPQGGS